MARPATAAVRLLTGEREPVRLATTANITLSGLQTIDGVLTEVGDRVLVKNQTNATQNGIYTASTGAWFRAADARTSRTMQKGTTVHTQAGSTNAAKVFSFQTDEPVIGTDNITLSLYLSDNALGDAQAAATAAAGSASAAAGSATAASTSATNAATSATNAGNSATAASGSASAAATSATNAGNAATAAAGSASSAATSATNAGNSATAAAGSASAAAGSAATINLPAPVANTFLKRNAGNTAYVPTAAIDGADVSYTQGGTSSLARTMQDRARERVSVLDFTGVDPTGVSDSRAGIVAADTAAAALGKALYFPKGNYLVSAAITPSSFACWLGESKAKVTLTTTSATADLLTVSNGSFTLDRISFGTNITRTAGSYINISANVVSITNFNMTGTFQGIFLSAAVSTIFVANGNISTANVSSIGIRLHGGVAVEIANMIVVWNGVAHPFACLYIDNGGDYSFTNCQFLAGTNGAQITPAAGQSVAYCRFTNCWFDTSLGAGLSITPTSTGTITSCDFVQCWFSTSGTHGVQMAPGASASVTNVNFANCFMLNNGSSGVTLTGAVISDCSFVNNTINGPGAAAGFSLNSGVVRARLQGNRLGGLLYGIFSDGTPTDAMIYDNSFVGCTNKIAGAWLGSTRIERNAGYNPVGAAGITPGASPYTYTAGASPETVYTSATTSITAATQGGVSILPAALGANVPLCIQLEPNEAVAITYTGTLTARKMVH
ncbi:right-handed parallel beta-helix repeat-containing protein [Mesorhizobium carmichaelinearum]|uniref:right-handed parallel beta-helix repeat-containing protein n=1 Tax=Mesorhizobium carmichaelinearum TaxID=1208188 RepID=UPI00117CB895|nr:right-handed parallel beta-helix repeat-containing protein [Mesorhizobium carmichaelinearum]